MLVTTQRRAGIDLGGLGGLGGCPSIAPYEYGGTCHNLPEGTYLEPGEAVPAGYFANTMTGMIEKLPVLPGSSYQEIVSTPGAAEASRAAAQAEGDAAVAAGRAAGLNVDCNVVANCGPVAAPDGTIVPGAEACLYWSNCSVNGDPGHDAGLLIRPGGLQIAAVETGATLKAQTQSQATSVEAAILALAKNEMSQYLGGRLTVWKWNWYTEQVTGQVGPAPEDMGLTSTGFYSFADYWRARKYTPKPATQADASAATGKPGASVPPAGGNVPANTGSTTKDKLSAQFFEETIADLGIPSEVGGISIWVIAAVGVGLLLMNKGGK